MFVLAIFRDRNDSINFVNSLKKRGINATVCSTPNGLGSACSLSAKFYYKDIEKVLNVFNLKNYYSFVNFYKIIKRGNKVIYEIIM